VRACEQCLSVVGLCRLGAYFDLARELSRRTTGEGTNPREAILAPTVTAAIKRPAVMVVDRLRSVSKLLGDRIDRITPKAPAPFFR
jgi:hypothetical protein